MVPKAAACKPIARGNWEPHIAKRIEEDAAIGDLLNGSIHHRKQQPSEDQGRKSDLRHEAVKQVV
jgi:hypothetical protein